jgi:hypothetical protein
VVPRTLAEEEIESCVSGDDVSEGAGSVVFEDEMPNPHTVVSRATSNLSSFSR